MRLPLIRNRRQKGAAFVETALVLGIFLFVLIGIVDFAQILHVHQALVERTRSVARDGAILGLTEAEIRNLIIYGQRESPSQESPPLAGYMRLTPSHLQVQILDRTFNEQRLVVDVSNVPLTIVSPLIAGQGRIIPLRISVPLEEP
jgi:hypothetical protein